MPDLAHNLQERPVTRWKLVLAYDGTDYSGWQVQPGKPTIQQVLMDAVQNITGETVLPQGSGRTDAGVHAQGQVVSLDLQAAIPAENLMRALNRVLPPAIRVRSAQTMPATFHARANAASKTYAYRIFLRRPHADEERVCPPERARFVWDCPYPLDLASMQTAAAAVLGTHDFTSFAAFDPDRAARMQKKENGPSNLRTIFRSAWEQREDELIYTVNGSGFLHHMVRNLVGTFAEIGTGRFSATAIPEILAARDRSSAGITAPPQGLSLVEVFYNPDAQREESE